MRTCHKCEQTKPAADFYNGKQCKSCRAAYLKAYRQANADKIRTYGAAYRAEHKDERAAYREANADRLRAQVRQWHSAHRDHLREYHRQYRDGNENYKQRMLFRTVKRQQRIKNAAVRDLTFEQWAAILEAQQGVCFYCWRTDRPLTQDHVLPLSRGGDHTASNVVGACAPCNTSKGNKTVAEWLSENQDDHLMMRDHQGNRVRSEASAMRSLNA